MFKRILVAVDGSTTAELALQEAIKLAGEAPGQLRVVHVVDLVSLNLSTELPNPPEVWETMVKGGKEILRKAGATANAAGIAAETGLIEIDTLGHRIPERIAADADAWQADLIVIGTHGRRGLSHLLLGSVAEGVARVATKPVLLIRGK
jgi:nucleotide-binding universal stress UspA family protein